MAATVKRVVLDASVALKWRFLEEEAAAEAAQMLNDHVNGALRFVTPTLFDYEIANALKSAVLKGRITDAEAVTALADYQTYTIEREDFGTIQSLALQLSLQHGRSVYDSAYLALALSSNLWFYTGDKRLFNAVTATLSWVQWIGDYRLDAIPDTP